MTGPAARAAQNPASFIPPTIGPWVSEADQTFDAETIFAYIDGAGEVYRSYNMKSLVARRFHKDGRPDIVVDLFDMGSAEDAFGVFTHDLDGEDVRIGQGSTYKGGLLSFWADRYFGSVYTEEETPETKGLVLELGRRIASAVPGRGGKPEILRYLPAQGLDEAKVRFFHNSSVLNYHHFVAEANILDLDQGTDVALAQYGAKGDRSVLLIAAYPDAGRAAKARDSFVAATMPKAGPGTAIRTENGRWTAVRVQDRFVVVVFDEPSEKAAAAALDAATGLMIGRGR